ncbi:tetratricopeptide repeat protein [Streptomyces sp. NPDC004959]|uniref:tetratricopeptide repeat protein n=1 Tax=Streptomyces sp. NPDC004959 TaxID=3154673 RepID=UPI0033BB31D1
MAQESAGRVELRAEHRAEAERLLTRSVEEEVRRGGGKLDASVLLGRAMAAVDEWTAPAAEEYAAYTTALDEAAAGAVSISTAFSSRTLGGPLLVTATATAAAFVADVALGTGVGAAVGAGATVAVAGAATTFVKATAGYWPAAHRRAGALGQPGGLEQARLQWLTALEVRGIRPYLDQQRLLARSVAAGTGGRSTGRRSGLVRTTDRGAAARRRSVLEQSFAHLPQPDGVFAGRRAELAEIARLVRSARAATRTRPVVVVLHGEPGSGRTTLAVRAAHALRDQFKGACVVDLRGGSPDTPPLPTRDALMHLLNRLGAPREQLLFRDRSSSEQQVRKLTELYRKHLHGLPVTVILDDASDAAQVRALLPEHSDSLVLVTARGPLDLAGPDTDSPEADGAWVHQFPVGALEAAGAEEVVRAGAGPLPGPYDAEAMDRIGELCGGLPLALRLAGSALGARSPRGLVADLAAYGPVAPVERALWLRYTDLAPEGQRLLRRLALAGRASLGAGAAAALLDVPERTATRLLAELAAAGLVDHVRGDRYRLHDVVRAFARTRLADEEEAAERTAALERLIVDYGELADAVIRLVDGKTSTRVGAPGPHGFASLEAALRWLDEESSFITAALRQAEGVDQRAVLDLLGALCDYCLLRGDLYRLGEISELTEAVDKGLLGRSVQWRKGIAARQLGELDTARTTLASVVDLYREAHNEPGTARALGSLGITLHHQGRLPEAAEKLREALALQSGDALGGDRGWTLHALAAVERDRGYPGEALALLRESLDLHRENESVHGLAWAHYQLGQVWLRLDEVERASDSLREALELYGRTRDGRGEAWALTQLARAELVAGDSAAAVEGLRAALSRHHENEDARGEAWTRYYLGQALDAEGVGDPALRELERARTMFSRMRDVYGLACSRHHSARLTRDHRAARTGSLRNSGFARQLLVDARADFQRMALAHGEAWTCLELAVIDAGNARLAQAVELTEEADRLFGSYGDRRGEDWARFLHASLLPYASAGGFEVGSAVAEEELAALAAAPHPARDEALGGYVEGYRLLLSRGAVPEDGWQGWRLGMIPGRHAREVMGVEAERAGW